MSAHYLVPETPIEEKNIIFQLVEQSKRAWHAGVSAWQKRSGLNDTSIGIELVNESYEQDGKIYYLPFTDHQINLLIQHACFLLFKCIFDRVIIQGALIPKQELF